MSLGWVAEGGGLKVFPPPYNFFEKNCFFKENFWDLSEFYKSKVTFLNSGAAWESPTDFVPIFII
jgi:hypothetical protein